MRRCTLLLILWLFLFIKGQGLHTLWQNQTYNCHLRKRHLVEKLMNNKISQIIFIDSKRIVAIFPFPLYSVLWDTERKTLLETNANYQFSQKLVFTSWNWSSIQSKPKQPFSFFDICLILVVKERKLCPVFSSVHLIGALGNIELPVFRLKRTI